MRKLLWIKTKRGTKTFKLQVFLVSFLFMKDDLAIFNNVTYYILSCECQKWCKWNMNSTISISASSQRNPISLATAMSYIPKTSCWKLRKYLKIMFGKIIWLLFLYYDVLSDQIVRKWIQWSLLPVQFHQ